MTDDIPVYFRPQRGSLRESMSEVRVFENISAMTETLAREYSGVIDICSTAVNDDRVGWKDSRYVICHSILKTDACVIGICATDVEVIDDERVSM